MDLQIFDAKRNAKLCALERVPNSATIKTVKDLMQKKYPKYYQDRQSFRLDPKGKPVKDSDTLSKLNLSSGGILYFKDLGPQLGWSTVFYCEYAGPLFIYLLFYFRPSFIYGGSDNRYEQVVHFAAMCHSFHYVKRILETKFIHRFSHNTMPIRNLFKNCCYYWTFAAWMAYFINHPLYTPPTYGDLQVKIGLGGFIFCELGNLSIHIALKNLRPSGSTERKIPCPTGNPYTLLFNFVSCPNYSYEAGSWIAFAVMTQSLVGVLFAFVGFAQMAIWALAKHRNYIREFSKYPRQRKAIVPFVL